MQLSKKNFLHNTVCCKYSLFTIVQEQIVPLHNDALISHHFRDIIHFIFEISKIIIVFVKKNPQNAKLPKITLERSEVRAERV